MSPPLKLVQSPAQLAGWFLPRAGRVDFVQHVAGQVMESGGDNTVAPVDHLPDKLELVQNV
jgi:hypothetical protein